MDIKKSKINHNKHNLRKASAKRADTLLIESVRGR